LFLRQHCHSALDGGTRVDAVVQAFYIGIVVEVDTPPIRVAEAEPVVSGANWLPAGKGRGMSDDGLFGHLVERIAWSDEVLDELMRHLLAAGISEERLLDAVRDATRARRNREKLLRAG
jgi:hypothetical protein